ncbi:MAG TPA: ABC transporter substrate-binding protein, partial [Actinomycetota bacterium]
EVDRTRRTLIVLAAMALIATACTGGGPERVGSTANSANPDLPRGGTLRVIVPENPGISRLTDGPALDPQKEYWFDSWALFHCCLVRTLLTYPGLPTKDGGAELRPDLAAEMPEVSREGLTWTFHLKAGIPYAPPLQDLDVAATDIIRALEREAAMASPDTYAFYYSVIEGFDDVVAGEAESISGLEAPDESTLIVHLTHPAGDLADLFAMPATAPIPPNPSAPSSRLGVAEGLGEYGRFLVATGPYMIEGSASLDVSVPPEDRAPISGYVPARSLALVRNPSWRPNTDALRPAYVDRIELTLGGTIDGAVHMIRRGEADLYIWDSPAPQVPLDVVERFLDHPELGVQVHVEPRDLVRYISMNLAVPPLDDLHVRKAINYAIDKNALLVLRGGRFVGDVAGHIVLDSLENGLLATYDPYPTSLAAAGREMARSRYDDDGDGRCDHSSCRGLLMLSTDTFPEMPALAESVRRDLQGIGIELRVEQVSFNATGRLYEPRAMVPLALFPAWGKDFLNASNFVAPLFSGDGIGGSQATNTSLVGATSEQLRRWGYEVTTVPSIDGKIDECLALVAEIQVRCWAEADQLLMEEVVPWVSYVSENKVFLVSHRVVAYSFDQFTNMPSLDRIAIAPV